MMTIATKNAPDNVIPHLEVRGISKTFGDTVALNGMSLSVTSGEFVMVLGPSGCGKTTLLDVLAGFDSPDAPGVVLLDGAPTATTGPDRSVVFQEAALFPWLTVEKNILMGISLKARRDKQELARELIKAVGLQDFAHKYPYQLSGGMKQRVSIARALVREPEVLLMDEPFGALDAQTRLAMQELLQRIWQQFKTTVVFITHDIDEAVFLGDRVIIMTPRPGRVERILDVPFERPRRIEILADPRFASIKGEVLQLLRHDS